jgi:prepilin-type N-terminal cleavage/methylation domain-containing protein
MFKPQTSLVSNKRSGFTLVELLIVIAIIAILVALSAGGVFKFLSYQKQAATAKTVDQVNAAIERVLKNIRTKAHTDYPTTPVKAVLTSIGVNLGVNLVGIREPNRRDELVFVDLQIARSFPLNFTSINAANKITVNFIPVVNMVNQSVINISFNSAMPLNLVTSLNVIPSIIQAFIGVTGTPSPEIQNAACLLLALEANPDGLKGELLGTAVTTDPVTKARYIATADGQPIGFQLRYLDSQAGGSKSVVGTVTVELIVP